MPYVGSPVKQSFQGHAVCSKNEWNRKSNSIYN